MSLISKHGISDIVIVRYLNTVKKNNVLYFGRITDNSFFTDYGAAPDKSTVANFCLMINYAGSPNISRGENVRCFRNPYIISYFIVLIRIQSRAELKDECLDIRENLPNVGPVFENLPGNRL